MASPRHDLAYALRRLGRSPTLVLAVVISIGLGIGANATIFSMISRFVLSSPPVGDPATLLNLHTTRLNDRCCNNFSLPLYKDIRDQNKSFSGVAAYYELVPASVGGKGHRSASGDRLSPRTTSMSPSSGCSGGAAFSAPRSRRRSSS